MPGTSVRRKLRCGEKQRLPVPEASADRLINALGIEGLAVSDLNLMTGSYVNLPYPLANGSTVRFLHDSDIYLGNQVEQEDSGRCYGVVANEDFILICEYGCNGSEPEIVLYKRR